MKRLILSVFLFILILPGYGQKHIRLSFSGSPSINWMVTNSKTAAREKSTLGYNFGLNADLYFSEDERYSLLTGLLINNTGGKMSYKNSSDFQFAGATLPASSTIRYRLRYIEIPLAIKLRTDQFKRMRYWGEFGLTNMINIDAKGDSNNGDLAKSNIRDEVKLFNLAMDVGLGFDFDLGGSNSITSGLIFQNGLTDVTTNNAFSDKTIVNSLKLKIGLIF